MQHYVPLITEGDLVLKQVQHKHQVQCDIFFDWRSPYMTSNYLAETRESAEKRKRRSAQAQRLLNTSVEIGPSERLSGSATTADKEFARRDFLVRLAPVRLPADL